MDSLQPQGRQNEPDTRTSMQRLCDTYGMPYEHIDSAQTHANQPAFNHRLIFKFIKADQFIHMYCPGVTNYKQKIAGTNRGRPVVFTEADKEAIRKGLATLFTDLTQQP